MVHETAFVPHGLCIPLPSVASPFLHSSSRTTATTLCTNEFLQKRNLTMRTRVLQPFRLAGLCASLPAETVSAETSTEVFRVASTTRSWKPLEVFSLSPLQKERARRVFTRHVSTTASPNGEVQDFGKESILKSDTGQELSQIDLIAAPGAVPTLRRSRKANVTVETSTDVGIVKEGASIEQTAHEETISVTEARDGERVSPALNGDSSLSSAFENIEVDSPKKTGRRRSQAEHTAMGTTANCQDLAKQASIETEEFLEKDSTRVLTSTEQIATEKRTGDDVKTSTVEAPKKTRRRRATTSRNIVEPKSWRSFASHQELVEEALQLTGDPLEKDGGRVVIFRGNPTANLMVIGEGPGAEEDRLGLPFVGKSGQLLNRVFRFAGFNVETDIYVTNVVKRRPQNNRAPTAAEVSFYRGLLLEEIRLVDPTLVILTGRIAMEAMLPDAAGITKMRGKWYSIGSRVAMPVFHPSYLLRNPSAKSVMKEDVLEIRRKYLECVPGAQLDEVRNQGSA